jgi:hypothetical protein
MRAFLSVILFLTLFVSVPLSAQRLAPDFASLRVQAPSSETSRARFGDYRVEGAAFGAIFLGVLGAWLGREACQGQPTPITTGGGGRSCTGDALTVGLVGGVVGGGLGYLLGRLTPKHR